ncbi:MAG TPA: DUF2505 domain-containing protein [Nannocystaceae bacterium]|nr:DUF2505 domain-containing protein [Nannocystaceae bacterium]
MKYRIEDTFDVSAERYWATFFDEEFNRALWKELDIEWEPLELDRKGEGADLVVTRRQRLTPKREMPAIIAKFVKGKLSYVEHNVFTASNNTMKTTTTPSFMADKIDTNGVFRIEVVGPDKVNRVWDGNCEVSIPLVGGKVEKLLVDEVRESYRKATAFTRKWHAEHPA